MLNSKIDQVIPGFWNRALVHSYRRSNSLDDFISILFVSKTKLKVSGENIDFPTYRLPYLQTSLLTDFPTYRLPYLQTSLLTDFPTYRLPHLQTSPLTDFPTYRLSYLQTFLLTDSLLTDFPTYRLTTLIFFVVICFLTLRCCIFFPLTSCF